MHAHTHPHTPCAQVIAECIEDAFAAGYTDDTLAKLLTEATAYIPPGTSIQAMNAYYLHLTSYYLHLTTYILQARPSKR